MFQKISTEPKFSPMDVFTDRRIAEQKKYKNNKWSFYILLCFCHVVFVLNFINYETFPLLRWHALRFQFSIEVAR